MSSKLTVDRANRLIHNKEHFDAFERHLKSEKEGPAKQYRSVIIRMLEYFDEKSIEITNVEDAHINEYAATQKRGNGAVFRGALVKFFTIVKAPRFHIDSLTAQKGKDKVERKAKILSVSEIIKVRNKLTAKDDYKLLFTFEMFYTHGITLGEIEQFRDGSYSISENTYTFVSEGRPKKITLCKVIAELINKHSDLLEAKGRATYSSYMQDIGSVVGFQDRDKIIWGDLDETRKEYFPTCSQCKEKYPNSDEFWALVQFEKDIYKKNWLYCRGCADKMKRDE